MNGIILINKSKGCTSHDVVYKVKKIFKEKVGHTGTLDPNATGVLPLLIGKATQCSKYLINHDKKYKVVLELGTKTTTADGEGEIIEQKEVDKNIFEKSFIKKVFEKSKGIQYQTPPIYSAIKVNGKKLYEYARSGQKVEIQPREITIYDLELFEIKTKEKQIVFEVACSKGTYIRSLCEDIAQKLNTIGYMKELQRTQVGEFKLDNTIDLEQLEKICKENKINLENIKAFITLEKLFENNSEIVLDNAELERFLNGVKIIKELPDGLYKINCKEKFIGTGIVKNKLLKRDIIILDF